MAQTTSAAKARPMGDVPEAWMGLLRAQLQFGQQMFEDVTGMKAPDLMQGIRNWQSAMQTPPSTTSGCTIPAPCWMPKPLGDVTSQACVCRTVRVRLLITNCDRVARTMHVRTDGVDGMVVSPASVTLNPMRRGTVEVSFKVPDGAEDGTEFETLVWVEGCSEHVLRWTIIAGSGGFDSMHEVMVRDCPDYRHHWYDHFYCARPCQHTRSPRNG